VTEPLANQQVMEQVWAAFVVHLRLTWCTYWMLEQTSRFVY